MRVSVIVPNYNHSEYLQQRVESIINQSFQDIEIIILDDCSTDNSRALIEQYRCHPKISHIIFNEQNSGSPFKQWLKGIDLAQGEWIWIAESDDWCEPDFLEELVHLTSKDPDAVLAYCQSLVVRNNSLLWKSIYTYPYLTESLIGREWIGEYMLGENRLRNASMAIFKKSKIKCVDKRFIDLKHCGDWMLWCEIAKQGTVSVSGKYLNYYRKHSSSTSSAQWKESYAFSERCELFRRLLNEHQFTDKQVYSGMLLLVTKLEKCESALPKKEFANISTQLKSVQPEIYEKVKSFMRLQRIKKGVKSIISRCLS